MRREEGSFSSAASYYDSSVSSEDGSFSSVSGFDSEATSEDGSGVLNSHTRQDHRDLEHFSVKQISGTCKSRTEAAAVTLKNGCVLVLGGCRGLDALKSGEVYGAEGRWEPLKKSMLTRRAGCAVVRIGDEVYAIGGWRNLHSLSSVEVLDTRTWAWKKSTALRKARSNFAAATLGRCIYVFGGKDRHSCRSLVDCERYNVDTGKWCKLPDLPKTKNSHARAAVAVGTKIYVLCNEDSYRQCSGCVWEFDTTSCTWTSRDMEPMPVPRSDFAAVAVLDRHVIVIGGAYGSLASTVDALDTVTGKWTTLSTRQQQAKQSDHWAVTLCDNSILVSGEWGASSRGAQQLFLSHLLATDEASSKTISNDDTLTSVEGFSEDSSEIVVEDGSEDSSNRLSISSDERCVDESSGQVKARCEGLSGVPSKEDKPARSTMRAAVHIGSSCSKELRDSDSFRTSSEETGSVATIKSPQALTLAQRLEFIEQRVGNTGQKSESIVGKLVAFERQWIGSVQRGSIVARLDRLEHVVSQQAASCEQRLEQLKIKSDLMLRSVVSLEKQLFGRVQDGSLSMRVRQLEEILGGDDDAE